MITNIENLFNVNYGQKEYEIKENLEEGKTMLVSSSGQDNGSYGFFDILPFYKAPFITVPRTGSIGQAFVQLRDCCANSDVLVLTTKEKLSLESLYEVAYQIRLNKWKYAYGRKITPDRLRKQKIRLDEIKTSFNKLSAELSPKENHKERLTENKNIKILKITDLCNIERKTALPQNAIALNGNTPYITTTSKDNGVSEFVDEEPNFKAKCLTVALNGSVGEVFFQIRDFITSSDNAVLTLKTGYNPYFLLYIGALIKTHQWRYNYYRKLTNAKLENMPIPIPFKNGTPDLDYIRQIVENSYGYKELKKHL